MAFLKEVFGFVFLVIFFYGFNPMVNYLRVSKHLLQIQEIQKIWVANTIWEVLQSRFGGLN